MIDVELEIDRERYTDVCKHGLLYIYIFPSSAHWEGLDVVIP